jgi:hypothetical protein
VHPGLLANRAGSLRVRFRSALSPHFLARSRRHVCRHRRPYRIQVRLVSTRIPFEPWALRFFSPLVFIPPRLRRPRASCRVRLAATDDFARTWHSCPQSRVLDLQKEVLPRLRQHLLRLALSSENPTSSQLPDQHRNSLLGPNTHSPLRPEVKV